jgi:hypothetical protein
MPSSLFEFHYTPATKPLLVAFVITSLLCYPEREVLFHFVIYTSYAVVSRREVWRDAVPPRNPFFACVGRRSRPTQAKKKILGGGGTAPTA